MEEESDSLREYENTYQMEPEKKFSPSAAKKTMQAILDQECSGVVYEASIANGLAKEICGKAQEAIKDHGYSRYKLAFQCTVGESRGQGVKVVSASLWDADLDGSASASFSSSTLFVVLNCFACYYE
eukprot:TRINITY_DN3148_c0_g1_i1.p1 TRINITY_DN3148_c0_g1~~TRINITY_DN3148_c0_g1_i1.p1  ORF type:complete len:138 (-),score=8.64 TRINITY_DN3148_c0_g1_i1:46-426(-)